MSLNNPALVAFHFRSWAHSLTPDFSSDEIRELTHPKRLVLLGLQSMASIEDLRMSHRLFMKAYRYRSVDWHPGAKLNKPLPEATLVIISTAGLHLPDQAAFDETVKGGDPSFRELPDAVDVRQLEIAHRSSAFDQTGIRQDRNLAFPLDRCRELVAQGRLGALNGRHFSFMGSITKPDKLIMETAPQVATKLQQDKVDAALLLPV
jgi:D-proline reductase (dithiol) PrdB